MIGIQTNSRGWAFAGSVITILAVAVYRIRVDLGLDTEQLRGLRTKVDDIALVLAEPDVAKIIADSKQSPFDGPYDFPDEKQ